MEVEEADRENSPFLKMYVNKHRVFILAKRPKNRGESEKEMAIMHSTGVRLAVGGSLFQKRKTQSR